MKVVSFWQSIGKDPDEDKSIEHLSDELIAVPDMSLSVRDILERFRRGTLDPESLERPFQDTDDDIDDDIFDDVDDMVDVLRLKEESYEKVRRSLQRDCDDSRGAESGFQQSAESGEVDSEEEK